MIFSSPAKAEEGEKVSSVEASVGGKRKVTGRSKVRADEPPQYSHWLMKSEPESRFQNGIDVKVCCSVPGSASECSCGLTGLVHLSVRDRGSEVYDTPNQLLGRRSEFSGWFIEPKHFKIALKSFDVLVNCRSCDLWPQARNFMRQMKKGQMAFFYHSNCKEPGIAGLMKASPASVPLMLWLAEINQRSATDCCISRSLRKRMWTTHSLIRKTSTLTPAVNQTTPNGAW